MSKRHGKIDENGKRMRRGNNSGSLFRKPGGNVWYMRFTERDKATGKVRRIAKSTGTDDLDEARKKLTEEAIRLGYGANVSQEEHIAKLQKAAGDIKAKIEHDKAKLEHEAEERRKIERKAAEDAAAAERDRNAVTFSEAWCLYADSKKRPDSGARTLAGYESQYQTFTSWLKTKYPTVTKMRDFTPTMAEAFIDHLDNTRSRSTRNKFLIFLRTFWRVLRWNPDAQLATDPWEGIRTVAASVDQVKHRDLSLDQIAAVAAVLNSTEPVPGYKIKDVFKFNDADIRDELRALFATGLFTGARLGDCATIKWSDIDTKARTWGYEPRKTSRKYHRRVTCYIHPTLEKVLAALPTFKSHRGYALPTIADIYLDKEPSMLTNRVQAIFRAAGIETTTEGENGTKSRTLIGFHSTRHFFNSWLNNHGVNTEVTNYLTCHDQGRVTATYYHQNREAIRAAVLTLPTIPTFAGDAESSVDAPQAVTKINATASPREPSDAPCTILDTLRTALATMSDSDLAAALDMVKAEAVHRQEHKTA